MEDAVGEEKHPSDLTLRVLVVNFSAIHTTSMVSSAFLGYIRLTLNVSMKTFSFALYRLLAQLVMHWIPYSALTMISSPEYIQPLRKEVESIVNEQGWTKASIFNMRKLDSFLREAQRLSSFPASEDFPPLKNLLTNLCFQLRWSARP